MKEETPIRVERFLQLGEESVNLDSLGEGERARLGSALKAAYLNALFCGTWRFWWEEKDFSQST
jgi:hypothetical protein